MESCVTWDNFRTVLIFIIGIVITEILHFIDLRRQLTKTQAVLLLQQQKIEAQKETLDRRDTPPPPLRDNYYENSDD